MRVALEVRRDLAAALLKRETDGIAFALALGAEKPTPVTLASGWPLAGLPTPSNARSAGKVTVRGGAWFGMSSSSTVSLTLE